MLDDDEPADRERSRRAAHRDCGGDVDAVVEGGARGDVVGARQQGDEEERREGGNWQGRGRGSLAHRLIVGSPGAALANAAAAARAAFPAAGQRAVLRTGSFQPGRTKWHV